MTGFEPLRGRVARVLTESELDAVHENTLRVLDKVGVRFNDAEALAVFRKCPDAEVDGAIVRFRPQLIERTIEQVPPKVTLHARNPKYDLPLGEGKTYYTSGFGATFVCDSENQTYRSATVKDVCTYLTLADALENVHYTLMPFVPQDAPPEFAELYAIAMQFNCTEKHVGLSTPHSNFVDEIIGIGKKVASDSGVEGPVFSWGCTVNSPLTFSEDMLPKTIKAARAGIPFRITTGAMAGATGPVTLAGTLVLQNAEVLAGMALCQLVNPGTPVIYGTFAGGMDMRVGKWASAGPEMVLINGAAAQLCKRYGIPLGYGTGGLSDSRIPDVRAGFEKALTVLFTALTGVEVIHHGVSGILAGAMAISFEQLIIDNEMANVVNRLLRGIQVDEGTLAFDVIKSVGPGGHFLDQEHTVAHFRKEHYMSPLMSREYLLEWPASDKETMLVQAREEVKEILASHHVPPLPRQTQAHIQGVVEQLTGTDPQLFGSPC